VLLLSLFFDPGNAQTRRALEQAGADEGLACPPSRDLPVQVYSLFRLPSALLQP
jgi:hypothetical protein